MSLTKRIASSRPVQAAVGALAAAYLRLVWHTSRFTLEPADLHERIASDLPLIAVMWHGQHFLVPFARRGLKFKVLITRHRDGEIYAACAERLGLGVIRGSGAHGGRFDRKGGVSAFKAMLKTLEEGCNMTLTADVPKVARVVGRGVLMLARASGRPILPVAVVTSRRLELDNWDKTAINLPFSRGAVVVGEPVRVPAECDDTELEAYRRQVEAGLNAVTRRGYEIVDGRSAKRG
jgi:lysophospholipid acyltransferase (LPLAT)-like uncharacterized protein